MSMLTLHYANMRAANKQKQSKAQTLERMEATRSSGFGLAADRGGAAADREARMPPATFWVNGYTFKVVVDRSERCRWGGVIMRADVEGVIKVAAIKGPSLLVTTSVDISFFFF